MRISDWSSDVCSSDLPRRRREEAVRRGLALRDILGADDERRHGQPRCGDTDIGKRARCRGDDGPALGGEAGEEGGRAGNFDDPVDFPYRSEEHKSELTSLMRISYAVFCLQKKKKLIWHIHI